MPRPKIPQNLEQKNIWFSIVPVAIKIIISGYYGLIQTISRSLARRVPLNEFYVLINSLFLFQIENSLPGDPAIPDHAREFQRMGE